MQQRAGGLNIKALLLIKEKLISQVKEFSIFLFGKMQESGLTVIMPFICNSAILGQYQDMFFFKSRAPLGFNYSPGGCQITGFLLLPECL